MITATVTFDASMMSISADGIGTRITSTLAMIPTGKIRSCHRPSDKPLGRGMAAEAIRNSGTGNDMPTDD
jgi:hypothetical protein